MQPPRTSGLAVASLIFGILAFFTGGLTGIVAVILGHMALSGIKRRPQETGGSGLAVGGLVTGYIGIAGLAFFFLTFGGLLLGLEKMGRITANAKAQQVEADFKALDTALMTYKLHARQYPTQEQGLDALIQKPTTNPVPDQWTQIMNQIPVDAWKNPYRYQFPGSMDATAPEIISSGPDGIAGSSDDMSSQKR